MYGTMPPPRRPQLPHAQTATRLETTFPPTTDPSRPLLTRSTTTDATSRPPNQPKTRPSLLKRISSQIDTALELSTSASYAHRNRPAQPSHWTDHAHREALLKTWDSIREAAAMEMSRSKPSSSVVAQVVATEKRMLLQFPELKQGEVILGREWVEYVLGVSLRHPFCAEGKMGRWEVLAGAGKVGGARAWGPW